MVNNARKSYRETEILTGDTGTLRRGKEKGKQTHRAVGLHLSPSGKLVARWRRGYYIEQNPTWTPNLPALSLAGVNLGTF